MSEPISIDRRIDPATAPDQPVEDMVQPFQIDRTGVRGRMVRLGPLVDGVLHRHAYPPPVAQLLGELLTVAAMLSHMLKFDGVFTIQIKGDGPISLMVADVTTAGGVRGYAQFDEAALAVAMAECDAESGLTGTAASEQKRVATFMERAVPRLLGQGYLAFTVDQGGGAEDRYQGIVALDGETLAACVQHYFDQSEQLKTSITYAVGRVTGADGQEVWRAGGIMLQKLPDEGPEPGYAAEIPPEDGVHAPPDEPWTRGCVLMQSATADELLDPNLTPHTLLYRLFHEDGVRVFPVQPLAHACRCSRARVETVLASLDANEVSGLKTDDGTVVVTCEFCSTDYVFDDDALAALYAERNGSGGS